MRRIFKMSHAELSAVPAARGYSRACHNAPPWYLVRLEALNAAGRFHGIESADSTAGEFASFLNAGDSYAPTVIYWRGAYRVQCIGDFVETLERRGIRFL